MGLKNNIERAWIKRHPLLASVPRRLRINVWSRIAVSRRFRFVYARIPKAANSTITRTLAIRLFPER